MNAPSNDTNNPSPVEKRLEIVRDYLSNSWGMDATAELFYGSRVSLNHLTNNEILHSLIELLSDPDFQIRITAACELIHHGNSCPEAERVCEDALLSPNYMQRFMAAIGLARCDNMPASIIRHFHRMFKSSDWSFRVIGAAALLGYSQTLLNDNDETINDNDATPLELRIQDIISVLRKALYGETTELLDESLRELAHCSLPNVDVITEDHIIYFRNFIINLLRDTAAFFLALRDIPIKDGHRRTSMEILCEVILDQSNEKWIASTVFLISETGPAAVDALPALLTLLSRPKTSKNIRRVVSDAIGKITKNRTVSKELLKPLNKAVEAEDWTTACNLVGSMIRLGKLPNSALNPMLILLECPDEKARSFAALTLGKFSKNPDVVVRALVERGKHESKMDVGISLIEGVVAIGKPAIPFLIEALVNNDPRQLSLITEALIRIGKFSADILAEELLICPSIRVKAAASSLLRLMGPHAKSAVPVAIRLLREGDPVTRMYSLLAISGIGHDAVEAVPEIITALSEPVLETRQWAESALLAIGPEALPAMELAFPNLDKGSQDRITRIAARLGKAVGQQAKGPDFEWIGDDQLLELFVLICDIFERTGVRSVRGVIPEIIKLQEAGKLPQRLAADYDDVRYSLKKLEAILNSKRTDAIKLMKTKKTRADGVSEDGRHYSDEFRKYLASKKKPGF